PDHVRHDRGVSRPFWPRGADRLAGPRRPERRRPVRWPLAGGIHRAGALRRPGAARGRGTPGGKRSRSRARAAGLAGRRGIKRSRLTASTRGERPHGAPLALPRIGADADLAAMSLFLPRPKPSFRCKEDGFSVAPPSGPEVFAWVH